MNVIYTVTTMKLVPLDDEQKKLHIADYSSEIRRCWCWFSSMELAESFVTNAQSLSWMPDLTHAIVEEVKEGFLSYGGKRRWYVVVRDAAGEAVLVERVMEDPMPRVVGFGIG